MLNSNRFYFLDFLPTKKLFTVFKKYNIEARFVGGCVRDAFMGMFSSDFDVAVNISIDRLLDILKIANIKYVDTNAKYGSIIVIIDNVKFDVTTLRVDVKCFGRGCEAASTSSFEEDAKRRDFTINALYVTETGEIYDYFQGVSDLKNKKVIFIGDPEQRIQEDYLRIFRYYRFCSKIGDKTNRYSDLLRKNAPNIKKLSIERIQKELFQIIEDYEIVHSMYSDGVLQQISKDLNIEAYKSCSQLDSTRLMKLIALFNFENIVNIFKFTREEQKIVKEYKQFINETLEYCYYKRGFEFVKQIVTLQQVLCNKSPIDPLIFKDLGVFPLTYKDLPSGVKNISEILNKCEKWWVNSGGPSLEETLKFMKSLL